MVRTMVPLGLVCLTVGALELDGSTVTVHATGDAPGDSLSVVRAVAAAVWTAGRDGDDRRGLIAGADETARQAVQRWSLAPPTID